MYNNYDIDEIDVDSLREDMKQESLGGFFIGGFGGAAMEVSDIDRMSDEEVVKKALRDGINLSNYQL